jgi:hypothetical protein
LRKRAFCFIKPKSINYDLKKIVQTQWSSLDGMHCNTRMDSPALQQQQHPQERQHQLLVCRRLLLLWT